MDATNFYKYSQKEFTDSQKKVADMWEKSQKELSESQKKVLYSFLDATRTSTVSQVDAYENFEKVKNFQREVINSALNAQQMAFSLAIETQKQFWDDYFQVSEKAAQETL